MTHLSQFVVLMVATFLITPAYADSPCDSDKFLQWDFWLGEWSVASLAGAPQGTNKITKVENGCLILEQWTSVQGGTGQSYNYYNPATDRWQQLWVSPGAIIDYQGGLTEAGAMSLEGKITYHSNGQVARFRGTWTPQSDGTVLQELDQHNAESGEWDVWFQGVYTRVVHKKGLDKKS
ncbi:MAG: hypothetical protein AAF541_19285 [Pseudomonadota bacterium]